MPGPIDVRLDSSLASRCCHTAARGGRSSCDACHLRPARPPLIDPDRPAAEWELDPAGFDDVWALRERLPSRAAWFCSPEPKAQQTAQLLTDGDVGIVDELREHERAPAGSTTSRDRVRGRLRRPDEPAAPGWEPLEPTRARLLPAVRRILDVHGDDDVVLVGHGTAWTLLVA